MGSGADFSAWLATNPIDLDVEKLNTADIIKKEKGDLVNVTTNDNVGKDEEKEDMTTKAMMEWLLKEPTKEPSNVQETTPEPWNQIVTETKKAPGSTRHHFRDDELVLMCGWQSCGLTFSDWTEFQEHVASQHLEEVRQGLEGVREDLEGMEDQKGLQCRWQGCRYGSDRFTGHRRHLNIHCFQVSQIILGSQHTLLAFLPNVFLVYYFILNFFPEM